jgi:hypothetical protein
MSKRTKQAVALPQQIVAHFNAIVDPREYHNLRWLNPFYLYHGRLYDNIETSSTPA